MGGASWKRPTAMTGEDHDGLALDPLPVVLGPFLPGYPNGLRVLDTAGPMLRRMAHLRGRLAPKN